MSALDQLIEKNEVPKIVFDAISLRPKKTSNTGFTNICCPLCVSRGYNLDKKFRCGLIHGDGITVTCFNCFFRARWRLGERLSRNMRDFLESLGVGVRQVQIAAYWADQVRSLMSYRPDVQSKHNVSLALDFPEASLPSGSKSLQDLVDEGCDDPDFLKTLDYLIASRGAAAATATTYYWSGDPELRRRLIIPCYHRDALVGWMARAISKDAKERYRKQLPSNYLFNSQVMTVPHRKYLLIVEGIFDALVIDGIGALGANLNEIQVSWIKASGKQPVIVPDRDKPGQNLIEIAIRHGWPVTFPHYGANAKTLWWHDDVKDPDEAVKRYGKLYTLQSILSSIAWNETQIRQRMIYKID